MATENHILLERIELGASASSVTFSNIPQTGYTDLKVVVSARSDTARSSNGFLFDIRPNGSSTNMTRRSVYGDGSTTASSSGTEGYNQALNPSNYTSNTFSSTEIYIPNYTSTNAKSMSTDSVSENNSTEVLTLLGAELWNPGTNVAITSLQFTALAGNFVSGSTFSLYGIAAVGTTPAIAPKASGGNVIATDGTYWYHAFLSNGTFAPQTALTCDYLVIAGGGAGGSSNDGQHGGGGGGAGGYLSSVGSSGGGASAGSALSLTAQNYAVTVGAGGASSSNGTDSTISTVTALGGGAGAIGASNNGNAGGSGGGGASSSSPGSGGAASSPTQGYAGGAGQGGNNYITGAGGGAGAPGGNGPSSNGGTSAGYGGIGKNTHSAWASATGTGVNSGYYAGGGGSGSGQFANPPANNTSTGGGGKGAFLNGGSSTLATAGTANTGSGGGGSHETGTGYGLEAGGQGGSGIVIIRYAVA